MKEVSETALPGSIQDYSIRDIHQAIRLLYGEPAYWKVRAAEWVLLVPMFASFVHGVEKGSWLWCVIALCGWIGHRSGNPAPTGIGMIVFAAIGLVFAGFAMVYQSAWAFAAAWLPLLSWCTVTAIRGTSMNYIEESIMQSTESQRQLREAGLLVHGNDVP